MEKNLSAQVNISMDRTLISKLDQMAKDDGIDNRSAFVRRLIKLELKRREKIKMKARENAGASN